MKRVHQQSFTKCRCGKCGQEAFSHPGKPHRRCGGDKATPTETNPEPGPVALREKHQGLESKLRGTWVACR